MRITRGLRRPAPGAGERGNAGAGFAGWDRGQAGFKCEGKRSARLMRIDYGITMAAGGGIARIEPLFVIGAGLFDGLV